MKYKAKKLPDGTYKVDQTMPVRVETSIVNEDILKDSIANLEDGITKKQEILDEKKELLEAIKSAK